MNHNGQFLPHSGHAPQQPQHFGQHNHGLVQYRNQPYPNQHGGYITGAGGGYPMASMGSPPGQRSDGSLYHQSGQGMVPSGYPAHALPGNLPSMHHRFPGYSAQTGQPTIVHHPQHQYYPQQYATGYHQHDPKAQMIPQAPPQHAMYTQQQHFQVQQQSQHQQHQQQQQIQQGHPYPSQDNAPAIYPQTQFRPTVPHGHQHPTYFQSAQPNHPNGYPYGYPQQRAPIQPGTPVMVPSHNSMAVNPMCPQQPPSNMVQGSFTQQHVSSHMRPQMRPRVPGAIPAHQYPIHSNQFQTLPTASTMNHMDSQYQHSNMRRQRQMPPTNGAPPQLQQTFPQPQEQSMHTVNAQGFSQTYVESQQNQSLNQINGSGSSDLIGTRSGQDMVSSGNYEEMSSQMNCNQEDGTQKHSYLPSVGPPDIQPSVKTMDQNMATMSGLESEEFSTFSQDSNEVMHLPNEVTTNLDTSMVVPIMTVPSMEEPNTENLPGPTPAVTVASVIATIDKKFTATVKVPFGWRRLVLSESVIYYSPSGVQLRSMDDVKSYLLREGTCKCGLECPIRIEESFDFDDTKHSEAQTFIMDSTIPSRYCAHKKLLAGLAALDKTPAFMTKIQHIHNPVISTKRGPRRTKKKVKAFSGMKVAQMLEAREVERQRINEIIKQQKQEYEAQLNHTAVTSTTQAIVSSVATTHVERPPTQVEKTDEALQDNLDPQSETSKTMTEPTSQSLEEQTTIETKSLSEHPKQGVSKNLEIRRMSNTEEGNKILNDAWTSPDKDKGQTPLQMVESIVSNIKNSPKEGNTPQVDQVNSPAETTSQGVVNSGAKGNIKKKSLAHIAPSPSVHVQNQTNMSTRALTLMQQHPSITVQTAPISVQISNTVQTTTSGVHHQQQTPVMQLVNTLNGPMIMHAVPFSGANVVHAMASSPSQLVHPIMPNQTQAIPISTSGLLSNATRPILKKRQKKKAELQQQNTGNSMAMPIIMSSAPALAASPATLTTGGTQQIIAIGQASQGAGIMSASHGLGQFLPHQNVMVNQAGQVVTNLGGQMIVSNGGALVAMPTVQTGMVLNQLPDGTFIQVPTTQGMISQLPILHGSGQQILANGGPIIMNSNPNGSSHQIIQSNGGTFILASPGGLVQAQGLASSLQQAGLVSPRQHQQIVISTPGPSSGQASPSKSNIISPNTSIKSHNTTPIELGDTSSSEEDDDDDDDDEDDDDDDDDDDGDDDGKNSSDSESGPRQQHSVTPSKQSPSTSGTRRKSPMKLSRPTTPVKSRSPRYNTPTKSSNNSKSSSKRSTPDSSKTSPRIFIQSNQVDSSGLKATPPHSACDFESPSTSSSHHHHHDLTKEAHEEDDEPCLDTSGSTDDGKGSRIKRRRKRNAEEILKEEINLSDEDESDESVNTVSEGPRQFSVGEVIWGAHGSFNSWPGKLIKTFPESRFVRVCWFGTKDVSEVESNALKSLSEGLEAHHRSIKKLRKGRKLNASLERAIQEAMTELD